MAAREPKPVKLKELLQEQQEPFIFDLYLLEKGYFRKSFNPTSGFTCCNGNPRKSLKRSVSFGLNPSNKKGITQCSKVFTAVYNQVISLNGRFRIKGSSRRNGNVNVEENKDRYNNQEAAEFDRFSSASSSTVFNSCSGSDAEENSTSQQKTQILFTPNDQRLCNLIREEAVTDRKHPWQCIVESRQFSPVSVLEEVSSLHYNKTGYFSAVKENNSSKTRALLPKEVTEDTILSASLWKILINSEAEKANIPQVPETQELAQSDISSKSLKPKTVIQLKQTKQLLFDCVREIVETQGRKEKQRQLLASEQIGKLIGEKVKLWGKQSKLAQLLEIEFLDSTQDWSCYEKQRWEMGFEIGDAIFEDMKSEIVTDMIDLITGC
ncbi:hypothetical protein JCGZ_15994 [Jatropha curcas]|uniref:DUF4378 domain-containing protein n=1 Tax=Jatropha curcas TaxID=180498 RepID=A0A067KZH5_JATCU|nr:uncharacterized protein LOC105630811 [Jatropha curcas]XP_020533632.1 uncharacterized protein LOC105630811 [Jatropha curcas]KDP41587.1 hypothetical protein JCGZ_15994 [Jatropha curcas]